MSTTPTLVDPYAQSATPAPLVDPYVPRGISPSLTPQEGQRATDALVYSHLTGAPPSFTYENRDAFHEDLMTRLGGYAEAGWKGLTKDSIIGEYMRGQVSGPFDSDDEVSKFIEGFGQMIGDLPAYLVGGGLGALAGGVAGTPELPVIGTISGAVIGAGAGGFGLTAGLRQWLMDKYAGKNISAWDEVMDVVKQSAKGALTGAAFGAAGEAAPLAEGMVGKYLGARAYKTAAELAAMTTVGGLLEGKVPSARDFAQNAALVALMHVTIGNLPFAKKSAPDLQTKAMDLYAREGLHPADLSSEAAQRAVDRAPSDNPMEILNRIDNEIAGIPGKTPDAVAESTTKGDVPEQPKGEAAPPSEGETSIKNEVTTAEREARGLSEVEVEVRQVSAFRAGKAAVDSPATDPSHIDPRELAKKLADNPRPHTDVEAAALLYDRMRLQNEHAATMTAIEEARATGNEAAEVVAQDRLSKIEDATNNNSVAARLSGTETGRALKARQMMIKQDYSLSNVLQRARVASPDGVVTPEVRNKLEALTSQLDEANKRIDEHTETKKQQAAERVVEKIKADTERATRAGKRVAVKADLDTEYASLIKNLNSELSHLYANPMLNPKLYELFGKLAVNRIQSGLLTIEQIVDDIHAQIQERGISKREIRDYISNYGRTVEMSKEDIQVKLREARAQGRLVSALEDAQKKQSPLRSGLQRDKPSDRVRELQKQVNEQIKKNSAELEQPKTPEEQWASALDAVKTRLKNQMKDIISRIEGKPKTETSPIKDDWVSEDLKWQRDFLKKTLEDIEGKPKMSDEQKVKMATAAVEKSITELEERIKNRDLSARKQEPGPTNAELESLRTRRDDLREQLDTLRRESKDQGGRKERAKVKALEKSITELEERIKNRDLSAKGKTEGPDTEPVSSLKAKRDALRDTVKELREAAKPKKNADEQNLGRYKSMLKKKIETMQKQLDTGNYTKPTRRTTVLDQQAEGLKAQAEKLKSQVDDAIHKQKLAARTPLEKGVATFQKWRRAVLLSSVNTLGKLTTAAMLRFGTTPIEELIGGVLSHVPGISEIAEKAPREGGGLSISAEAKAFSQFFDKATAQDIREALKTGKTSLDYLYGKKNTLPPEALDFFGHLHGALKVLPKRAEFFRSFEKRAQWALDNHLDIEDPKVQATIAADAYIDANRAIFMQENFINTGFRLLMNYFHSQGLSGKATEFMIQTVLPIVKVPTNIVAETGSYAFGSVTGSIDALRVIVSKDGLKNLTGHEADNIMRSLKKGSVGLAVLAIGYYAGRAGGFIESTGFYQPGDDKKPKKAETLTVGGVDLPPWIQHTPVGLVMEMGATMRRVNDAYTVKGKSGGFVAGAASAGLGAAKKVPFLEEGTRLAEATRTSDSAGLFLDDLIQSLIVPPDVRRLAQAGDTQKRQPTDLKESIEQGIPGLREDVPVKGKKRKFSIRGGYR
ncbi:MAG: hypothetical protein WB524_14835 [Acidobacteriaceae bacterium]